MNRRRIEMKRSALNSNNTTDSRNKNSLAIVFICLLPILLSVFCGCSNQNKDRFITTRLDQFQRRPRIRIGSVVTPLIWTKYVECEQLGKHGYKFGNLEENGIIYTCQAGHVDIAHVRNNADWTAHLSAIVYDNLRRNNTSFDFKVENDSIYHVELKYPDNWQTYSPVAKYRAMKDVSIGLGQYFTYIASIWHEMITWFGYKSRGIYSEFHSAFSWEDSFSNVLGSSLGVLALLDNLHSYDEAMTILLHQQIENFEPQSSDVAREVTQQLEGQWISSHIISVEMRKRNFDVGLIDGYVTPVILALGCEDQDDTPLEIKAPSTDFLNEYGFSMKFEIEPREWERRKILEIIYPQPDSADQRIDPRLHFVKILEHIKQADAQKYGKNVKSP
ncbi:MAG: DUF4056 domain-containing protein [Planctomycetota bacterium]|jgi:hypothetical protein